MYRGGGGELAEGVDLINKNSFCFYTRTLKILLIKQKWTLKQFSSKVIQENNKHLKEIIHIYIKQIQFLLGTSPQPV